MMHITFACIMMCTALPGWEGPAHHTYPAMMALRLRLLAPAGPLGLYAFGLTTALLQVRPLHDAGAGPLQHARMRVCMRAFIFRQQHGLPQCGHHGKPGGGRS
jgi:hypothetical protein